MSPDLFWIPGPWRGKVAIITRPRGGDWLEDEIVGWRQAGLDVVVSFFLEDFEADQLGLSCEGVVAKDAGIDFVSFPIPDRSIPGSSRAAQAMLHEVFVAVDGGKTVAVHCRQGIGRSGMVAVGLLMLGGIGLEDAINRVGSARGRTIPETPEQMEWLRRWSEELVPSVS